MTRIARSMDENELEVEILQTFRVNGAEKFHEFKMHFVGARSRNLPYAKMKVQRCKVFGDTFEMVDEKGFIADVSFKEGNVIYADDYEKAFSR